MSNLIYLKITGETQGSISAGCGTFESVGNRWQKNHIDEIFVFALTNGMCNKGNSLQTQALRVNKLVDKSSPLLTNAITNNERLFVEIDFWRINKTGHWERYYYIQLRNAFIADIHSTFALNTLHTEDISLVYDYIYCKHLIANTEFYYLALPVERHDIFVPQTPPPVSPPKPVITPAAKKTPTLPPVTPVYAKSCLKEKGCTDAGNTEEPAEHFGQMAIFAQPTVDDCCGYAPQKRESASAAPLVLGGIMSQVWGEWSLGGVLNAARGTPYIGALASALYIPAAGEGSARVPGRDEFWYEDALRQKAQTGSTATTRVRFFWGTDIHGAPQVYGVHTGEGTPYENVRVANVVWNADAGRYEFTPAGGVDGPLITWTPGKPDSGDTPSHTGNDVKPLDQATILVTPIPDGKDAYTTPPFPVPEAEDFNDYILVFPADSGVQPIYVYLKTARDEPGTATGNGEVLPTNKRWLEAASSGMGAPIPVQVADKLRGRTFRNFSHFRNEFWLAVSECPELISQFSESNRTIIKHKGSPFVIVEQAVGGRELHELHHLEQIQYDGSVYDMNNLRVNTPRNHIRIHKEDK